MPRGNVVYSRPMTNGEASFKDANLVVHAVLASSSLDRDKDVIDLLGVEQAFHQINPVVMFEHGLNRNFPFPVGKTVDPSQRYTPVVTKERITGDIYFCPHLPEAVKLYELWRDQYISGSSIGIIPLKTRPNPRINKGRFIDTSELLEYTICAIPQNRLAVRQILSMSDVPEVVRKSVYARQPLSSALTLSTRIHKQMPLNPPDAGAAPPVDDATLPEEPSETQQEPHGSKYIRSMYDSLTLPFMQAEAESSMLELDDVKELSDDTLSMLKDVLDNMRAVHKATYPDADELPEVTFTPIAGKKASKDKASDKEAPKDDEGTPVQKSAMSKANSLVVSEAAEYIEEVASDSSNGLKSVYRKAGQVHARNLRELCGVGKDDAAVSKSETFRRKALGIRLERLAKLASHRAAQQQGTNNGTG